LNWAGHVERMEDRKIGKDSRYPESGGKEDRECDWRTELGEVCKEWEENGAQKERRNWRLLIENVVRDK